MLAALGAFACVLACAQADIAEYGGDYEPHPYKKMDPTSVFERELWDGQDDLMSHLVQGKMPKGKKIFDEELSNVKRAADKANPGLAKIDSSMGDFVPDNGFDGVGGKYDNKKPDGPPHPWDDATEPLGGGHSRRLLMI